MLNTSAFTKYNMFLDQRLDGCVKTFLSTSEIFGLMLGFGFKLKQHSY